MEIPDQVDHVPPKDPIHPDQQHKAKRKEPIHNSSDQNSNSAFDVVRIIQTGSLNFDSTEQNSFERSPLIGKD